MAADDDAECVEHVFEVTGLAMGPEGSYMTLGCLRCPAVVLDPPRLPEPGLPAGAA